MMEENIEDIENRDVIDLDLQELRYKHIILRGLQKTAINEIIILEKKNVDLMNEVISLKDTIQTLSEANVIANKLMTNALVNNNSMKDDYRIEIQRLKSELEKLKNKE